MADNRPHLVVFEDSTKSRFAGGQKVTLEVIRILRDDFRVHLVDGNLGSVFCTKARPLVENAWRIFAFGRISGRKSSFSLGLAEILVYPLTYIANLVKILWILRRHRILPGNTILYPTAKKGLVLAASLSALAGYSTLFHCHSFDDRRSLFYRLIISPAQKACCRILCVSRLIRDNIGLSTCTHLYNPIPEVPDARPRSRRSGRFVVAMFAALIPWKGVDVFLRSHALLRNMKRIEYRVYGAGEELEALRRLESPGARLMGFTDAPERILAEEVDLVVIASISNEACPMTPLEAMSHGIPVVTTGIGGQAEVVPDGVTGVHVPPGDPAAMAEAVDRLFEEPELYERLSTAALTHAAGFSPNSFRERFLEEIGRVRAGLV